MYYIRYYKNCKSSLAQASDAGLTGVKSRYWQGSIPSEGLREESISLLFLASSGISHFLAYGPFLILLIKQGWVLSTAHITEL